jgi:hypothetical protein
MIMQHLRDPSIFIDAIQFDVEDYQSFLTLIGKRLGKSKVTVPRANRHPQSLCFEVEIPGEPPIILCDKDYVLLHSTGNITVMNATELVSMYGFAVRPGAVPN